MPPLVGRTNDSFAIFATPSGHDAFCVLVFPEIPEAPRGTNITLAKWLTFLRQQTSNVEAFGDTDESDVFVHSLTEEEVRRLTMDDGGASSMQVH